MVGVWDAGNNLNDASNEGKRLTMLKERDTKNGPLTSEI